MTPYTELERATAELADAVELGDIERAQRAVESRRGMLASGAIEAGARVEALITSGRETLIGLRARQSNLRQEIARLQRARGTLVAYEPVRNGHRRLDIQL